MTLSVVYGGSRLPTITYKKLTDARERSAFSCDSIEIVEISVHLEKQKRFIYNMFLKINTLLQSTIFLVTQIIHFAAIIGNYGAKIVNIEI